MTLADVSSKNLKKVIFCHVCCRVFFESSVLNRSTKRTLLRSPFHDTLEERYLWHGTGNAISYRFGEDGPFIETSKMSTNVVVDPDEYIINNQVVDVESTYAGECGTAVPWSVGKSETKQRFKTVRRLSRPPHPLTSHRRPIII